MQKEGGMMCKNQNRDGYIEMDQVSKVVALPDGRQMRVLDKVSIRIRQGEMVGLAGGNGSGKTTLARLLNGLLEPSSGQVVIDGMHTQDRRYLAEIRSRIGMIFQNPDHQIVSSVVAEDIAFGPENLGLSAVEVERRTRWAMQLTGISDLGARDPATLSGGQKQRVAIAAVLAMQPAHLILDEPTSMLDPWGRQELMEAVRSLNREWGITVLLISHHPDELLQTHRLIVLEQGRIAADGKPEQVLAQATDQDQWDVGMPDLLYLARELNRMGIFVPQGIATAEGLVDWICR